MSTCFLTGKRGIVQDEALGGPAVAAYSPGPGLVALNRGDMHAFIALAAFFAKLLPQLGPQPFVRSGPSP